MICLPAGPHDRTGIALSATWTRLRFAFAGCLQSALTHQGSDTLDKEDPYSPEAQLGSALQMDTRGVLILELLLAGLAGPAPSLTHLLMGFDVTQGPDGAPHCISKTCAETTPAVSGNRGSCFVVVGSLPSFKQ